MAKDSIKMESLVFFANMICRMGLHAGVQIVFQLGNGFLLMLDGFADQVMDRHNSEYFIIFKNRQVADVFICHQLHTVFNAILQVDCRQVVGHDL